MASRNAFLVVLLVLAAGAAAWALLFSGRESKSAAPVDEAETPRDERPPPPASKGDRPMAATEKVDPEAPPVALPDLLVEIGGPVELKLPRVTTTGILDGDEVLGALLAFERTLPAKGDEPERVVKVKVRWGSEAARAAFRASRLSVLPFHPREGPFDTILVDDVMLAGRAAGFDVRWAPPVLWIDRK